MQNKVKKIYELLHSPILTPYNLLENVKLDSYSYVNYYKGEIGIICEMKCTDQNSIEAKYYYHFDEKDHLFKVLMDSSDGCQVELFNRNSELQQEVNNYSRQKYQNLSAVK
ncbi:hypothetical protein [Neobacillus terrae]|uniref:hypothetical protein n=1 Tax=Neobacillus terrae TaxID=3034837 RepID=UPI00140AC042|nr:hypothetical protein [Neobacillus terrae]NHM31277.1 hypothetical protein [Neobacillus terrae]